MDAQKFRRDKEALLGGKIRFLTYTKYMGKAASQKMVNRGGVLFVIDDTIYFEDFERTGGMVLLLNKKEEYSKTEFSIKLDKITIVKKIKEKDAKHCIQGTIEENEILPARTGIGSLFFQIVIQVFIEGQSSIFLDFLEPDGFIKLINEYMHRLE